jgi:hypothetical protein
MKINCLQPCISFWMRAWNWSFLLVFTKHRKGSNDNRPLVTRMLEKRWPSYKNSLSSCFEPPMKSVFQTPPWGFEDQQLCCCVGEESPDPMFDRIIGRTFFWQWGQCRTNQEEDDEIKTTHKVETKQKTSSGPSSVLLKGDLIAMEVRAIYNTKSDSISDATSIHARARQTLGLQFLCIRTAEKEKARFTDHVRWLTSLWYVCKRTWIAIFPTFTDDKIVRSCWLGNSVFSLRSDNRPWRAPDWFAGQHYFNPRSSLYLKVTDSVLSTFSLLLHPFSSSHRH